MLIRPAPDIRSSEITPEGVYLNRRAFLGVAAASGLVAAAGLVAPALLRRGAGDGSAEAAGEVVLDGPPRQDELTSFEAVTSYNNFYEFGTGKEDPKENAHTLRPRPWTVAVDGEVAKPGRYALDDFLKPHRIQDRTYRMRCVEAWSMVIPWQGIPLADVLARVQPTSKARFVEFTTLLDPKQMPGQRTGVLPWPYREALRLDEAQHPLTILATGLYGKPLPNQNGAPLRLVVPWKYGFKSIKSIVRIRLTDRQPATTWNLAAGDEYGFYANVNPEVDHPRWSQARERRIGDWRRIPTLPFNGYADQVARLYAGMDLRKNY